MDDLTPYYLLGFAIGAAVGPLIAYAIVRRFDLW